MNALSGTTKWILIALTIGVWANVLGRFIEPISAQAQGGTVTSYAVALVGAEATEFRMPNMESYADAKLAYLAPAGIMKALTALPKSGWRLHSVVNTQLGDVVIVQK